MLRLLVQSALLVGRPLTQLMLWPIALYFWVTGGHTRRASHEFLRRVSGGRPPFGSVLRHFHTFAAVSVDRVYLLSGRGSRPRIDARVPDEVLRVLSARRGCLLLVAHLGSFEALRLQGTVRNEAPIRIVLDRQVGRMAMRLLEQLNPRLAAGIIDASRRGPDVVLDIKQALDAGSAVGIMADRARSDERAVIVRFLDGRARLPAGPWLIAGALGVPVVLGFGIYERARYHCQLELFADRVILPRSARDAALQDYAQRYAARLEEQARAHPFNWFNFYDYWLNEDGRDEERDRDAAAAH